MWEHLGGLPCQTPAKSAVCLGRLTCYRPVTLVVTNSEYSQRWNLQAFRGRKRNLEHIKRLEPVFGGKRANLEKRVFSAFCSKNGAVTKR